MTTATKQAQALLAKMIFEQASNIYLGLGKSTPWADENTVPDTNPESTALDEPIAYMKAQKVFLCKKVDKATNNTVALGGSFFLPVANNEVVDPDAVYVYVSSKFDYASLQKEIQFREVGMFVGFKPKADAKNTIILPPQVDKLGTMVSIQNIKLINITKTSPVTVGAVYSVLPALD